jgi:hypothetical protein
LVNRQASRPRGRADPDSGSWKRGAKGYNRGGIANPQF